MKILFKNSLFFAIILCSALVIGLMPKTCGQVYAESDISDNFNAYLTTYSKDSEKPYQISPSSGVFEDGCTFLIQGSEALVLTFGEETDSLDYPSRIENLVVQIEVNGSSFDISATGEVSTYGFEISEREQWNEINTRYIIKINPEIASSFSYGKYSITFSYYFENDDLTFTPKTASHNFYILEASNYLNNIKVENAKSDPDNAQYRYYSYYSTKDLMYLSYDYRYFNIDIVRSYQGLKTETYLYYDGSLEISSKNELEQSTESHNVDISYDEQSNIAYITFRNLGIYYLTYQAINPVGYESLGTFYNREPNESATAYVFGYQAYFTTNNGLGEFKNTEENLYEISGSQNSADITGIIGGDINKALEISYNDIAKTNQAPVYFNTNATVDVADSRYYYFANESDFEACGSLDDDTEYLGTPLSNAGVYLVQLSFKYSNYDSGNTSVSQYFLFRITNDAPEVTMVDENGLAISSDEFTNHNVTISKSTSSIFDATSTLSIYADTQFNGNYTPAGIVAEGESIVLENTAKYRVVLSYGNSNQKGFVTYFVIDKSPIEEIEVKSTRTMYGVVSTVVEQIAGGSMGNSALSSSPVVISWKEKASGATITAEYKYFATKYSNTFISSLSQNELSTLYNSNGASRYSIPSSYTFTYAGGTIPTAEYTNTYGYTTYLENQMLSAGGLYIFYISDNTGAEGQYLYIFIDNTENNVLSYSDSQYNLAGKSEVTTEDTTLFFGTNKLIRLGANAGTGWDEWLVEYVASSGKFMSYQGIVYMSIGINSKLYYDVNSTTMYYELSTSNDYGFRMQAETDGTYNENQYNFFTISESTNGYSLYDRDSYNYYAGNFTSANTVRFSTDNSKMVVYYYTNGGQTSLLNQCDITQTDADTKSAYHEPVSEATVGTDGKLYLSYCTLPRADLPVESITINYYAFKKDAVKGTYYFDTTTPSATIGVYEANSYNRGSATDGASYTYVYAINVEQFNSSRERTAAGRYEVIRTYQNGTTLEYDPEVRVLVFIVDRNGIISSPDSNGLGGSIYYSGGSISLGITGNSSNFYQDSTLHFYDIYYASRLSANALSPVLTTNLLPVTVYIPEFQYGYVSKLENGNGIQFSKETSITDYLEDKTYSKYRLSAEVEYFLEPNTDAVWNRLYQNVTNTGFLTMGDSSDPITSFDAEGYYKVTITSGMGDTFTFVFRITYLAPEFNILTTGGEELGADDNGVYYTNKNTVRIAWEDSANKYLAKINKEKIYYNNVSNGTYGYINSSYIESNEDGTKHFVDLDLNTIGAYFDNADVYITLQFIGEESDYNNADYFKKTMHLHVDLQAPTINLSNLISKSGLSFAELREYVDGNKYNVSKTSGLLKYFSFTLDVNELDNYLSVPYGDKDCDFYTMYYRAFLGSSNQNTKYVAGNDIETDITSTYLAGMSRLFGNSGLGLGSLSRYVGKYVELIEEDYAGNRSVYTIYISDASSNMNREILSYKKLVNSGVDDNDNVSVTFEDLASNGGNMSLYSKYSFNLNNVDTIQNDELNNLSWSVVGVNNVIFVKSPYTNGKYYKLNTYVEGEENTPYGIDELSLLSSSSNTQNVTLFSVPVVGIANFDIYVLNQSLTYYTLASSEDANLEGILIKLPNGNNQNELFASSIRIDGTSASTSKVILSASDYQANFLKEEGGEISQTECNISYVTYRGSRFVRIQILGLYGRLNVNDYFIYTIVDNFGEVYKIAHIYGQTVINNPISSDGYIALTYNSDGALVYYSSENIKYSFDTTIYGRATVVVSSTPYGRLMENNTYEITKTATSFTVSKNGTEVIADEYNDVLIITTIGNVMQIEMVNIEYDFESRLFGGSRAFSVTLVARSSFEIEDEVTNFEIYNALPETLSLMSKQNAEDITFILSGKSAYTGDVIVSLLTYSLKFNYEIFVINPSGEMYQLIDELEFGEDGTYTLIINYLGDIAGCSKSFNFRIARGSTYVYSVVRYEADGTYSEVKATGSSYTYIKDGQTRTISTHYVVNCDYEIVTNSNLGLDISYEKIDNYTTICTITNINNTDKYIAEYYLIKIAISQVEKTSTVISRIQTSGGTIREQVSNILALQSPTITPYVTNQDEYENGITVTWSSYNIIPQNTVTVTIYYGDINGVLYTPIVMETIQYNSITLKTSGTYFLRFSDLAGNTHYFGTYNDYEFLTIRFLSSVIYEVEGETPINYAIYDHDVTVSVSESTVSYYDINGKPKLHVEYNGEEYTDYVKNSNYSFTFNEAGVYKVWFSASIDQRAIYEAPLYFTILSPSESRLSYTYNAYNNYYIEDILLNGKSVIDSFVNVNNELYGNYLKSLSLSVNDIKTGSGYWTFVVNANNEFNQTFSFTIWINKANIPIYISVANGESTNNIITVQFNTSILLEEAGDCIIKITGFSDLMLTSELLSSGDIESDYEITLDTARGYYVEITTLSGQLLYSSYVVKTEPLNAISIIIIAVVSVVVITGMVVFIVMRKRMKVK